MGYQEQAIQFDTDRQSSVIFRYEVHSRKPVPLASVPRPMGICSYGVLPSHLDLGE